MIGKHFKQKSMEKKIIFFVTQYSNMPPVDFAASTRASYFVDSKEKALHVEGRNPIEVTKLETKAHNTRGAPEFAHI